MPHKVLNVDLKNREHRARLPIRTKPYWIGLHEGAHLGYYRGRRVTMAAWRSELTAEDDLFHCIP